MSERVVIVTGAGASGALFQKVNVTGHGLLLRLRVFVRQLK